MSRSPISLRTRRPVLKYCPGHGSPVIDIPAPSPAVVRPEASSPETSSRNIHLVEQIEINNMAEQLGPLLEQMAQLTDALNGSTERQEAASVQLATELREKLRSDAREGNWRNSSCAKIENFSGQGQDITTWLEQFDQFSDFNGWGDKRKANGLPLFLSGMARTFYATLPEDVKGEFRASADHLVKRFGATQLEFLERQELSARAQKTGETLDSYIEAIQSKSNRLKLSENERLQVFVQNLLPHLREYVILGNPKTYDEAERLARLKDSLHPPPTQKGIDNDTLKLLQELVNSKKMPAVAATEPNNFRKHEDFNAESVQGAISDLYNKINNLQATARNQNYSSQGPQTFDGTYQQHSSWYEPSGYYGEHQQVPGQDRRSLWKSGSFRTPNRFNYSRRGAGRGNSSGFRTRDGQVICSTCEGVGHYARSCPVLSSGPSSRPQNSQNPQQNLARRGHGNFRGNHHLNPDFSGRNHHVNVVTWAPEGTDCAQTGAQLLGGMASGTQEPLQVKCLVNGVPTKSLVDTGSQITVVSKDFWQRLPDGLRPPISKEGHAAIRTVSGQILNPIGSAPFQFEIMNSLFNFRAFILPELEQQAILGLDFLKASKFAIDFVHNTITIPSQFKETTYNSKNSSFWTPQGKPICFCCKKAGHTVKFCFQRSKVKRPLYRIPSTTPQRSATLRQHKIPVIATISASDRPTECEGVTSSVSRALDYSPRDMILHKHKFNKNPASHLLLTALTICAIIAFLLLVSKLGLVNANEVANTQSRKVCLPVRLSDDRYLVREYQLSMDPRNVSRYKSDNFSSPILRGKSFSKCKYASLLCTWDKLVKSQAFVNGRHYFIREVCYAMKVTNFRSLDDTKALSKFGSDKD